jgi:hypothetical protein
MMLTKARAPTSVVVSARHGFRAPKAHPAVTSKSVRMHTRSEVLSGTGVSQLAAEMTPFAGTNCYYLLVG